MKHWMKIALWFLFIVGIVVTMYFVQKTLAESFAGDPEVLVNVEGENVFITENELIQSLKTQQLIFPGQKKEEIKIEAIEEFIMKMSQVKDAKVFVELTGKWKIEISLRKPIARIFNTVGESYYLDSEGVPMSMSNKHTARVMIVNGYVNDRRSSAPVSEIINNDSLKSIRKLDDIYRISSYVCNDPLLQSLIGQAYLEKNGDFVLIPLVGDQKIIFGTARTDEEVREKFEKLKIFYNEAIPYEGWNTYSEISLKYKDQIVGKKKKTNE